MEEELKANAPEKIYVVDITFPDYVDFDGSPINTKRTDDHDIEYTRTDAFIEKACEWIENDLCCYIKAQDFIIEHERLVNDFKKAMTL